MDFGLINIKISNLTANAMAKLSHNIITMEFKELVFNSDSEEQCASNVLDTECTYDIRTR
jgi:hypothetical protein